MVIEIIILLLAIPTGYLIAWLANDELVIGRKWFTALIIFSFLSGFIFYFIDKIYITLTNVFIIVVAFISLMKSYDKKWIRKI
ncbi:MAG: hypothetical protein AABX83_01480 [Nanoarchaeota archaeon]